MEKFNDARPTYDNLYANNNNNITKSLNEPEIEHRHGRVDDNGDDDDNDNDGGEAKSSRCSGRETAAAAKIWSPLRSSSSTASTSSELDVESRLASPDIDVTKCNTPSPVPVVVAVKPSPLTTAKNSEAFSVSALLKPDAPRTRHPFNPHNHHHHHNHNHHHQQHHQQQQQQQQQHQQQAATAVMAAETISVTRSLLYPAVQFPDLIKDTRKEVQVHLHPSSAATNSLLQKHFPGFGFHPHFYSAANMLNPPTVGSPEHGSSGGGGDTHTDNNHNLLTSSLYLSLGAVQAAAAAAFVHPLSTTGKTPLLFYIIVIYTMNVHNVQQCE